MGNEQKAVLLYGRANSFSSSGNKLVADQMEKLADHYGSLYVKEALSRAKKKITKKAYMEKPIKTSMPHSGLKKRALRDKTAVDYKKIWGGIRDFGQEFNKSQGFLPKMVRNVGYGAAVSSVPLAGAAYFAPKVLRDSAESTTEGVMDKVKEYAVPAALLLAGAGTAAYSAYSNKDAIADKARQYMPFNRTKVSHVIQGVKYRNKLASQFGESSEETDICDKALSRLLFKE